MSLQLKPFNKPEFQIGALTVVNQSAGPVLPQAKQIESYTNLVFYPDEDDRKLIIAIGDVYYTDGQWFAGVAVQLKIIASAPRATEEPPEEWADKAIHELASWIWPPVWDYAAARLRSLTSVMTLSTLEIPDRAPTDVNYSTHSSDK